MGLAEFASSKLKLRSNVIRIILAEFQGTFILALIGIGAGFAGHSSALAGSIAGGLGVTLGIFTAANVSGGHINPAVTAGFWIQGRLGNNFLSNTIMMLIYFAAQIGGAFCGAAMAHLIYLAKIEFENKESLTCSFATCPTDAYEINPGLMLVDQMVGAWVLVTTVLSTTDPKNANPPGMAPYFIGLSATAVGLAWGGNAGGAINPARDFGPRLWAAIFDGDIAFSGEEDILNSEYFFWIPLLGPLIGGAIAGLTYLFLVSAHWPDESDPESKRSSTKVEDVEMQEPRSKQEEMESL